MNKHAEIVRLHGGMVWQTVYRLTGREEDARDCFQETFVKALALAEKEPIRNWIGVLKRVATMTAVDALRRRVRERERDRGDWDAVAARGAGPEAEAMNAESMER